MNEHLEEIKGNNSENPILDIVNTIQNKLNDNNSYVDSNTNSNKQNTKDLNSLDISKLLEGLTNGSPKTNLNNMSSNNSGLNLDLNTIMNFQKILGGVNQTDPRKDLLTSLKPFLRANRQKNIDTYITLLGVMKAFNIFSNKDSD